METGKLYGLGIGPGNPELITLKAYKILSQVPVVAYPMSPNGKTLARSIVADYLQHKPVEIAMYFPFKLEESSQPYYDKESETISEYLNKGLDVAVLCEGDPFFYGTFMYIFNRLSSKYQTEIVPGISSMMASASALGTPLTYRNDVFMVLSAILPAEILAAKLSVADAAVILKLGRHFPKVYQVLKDLGLDQRARYVERATMPNQKIIPISELNPEQVPYFSMIVIPSQWQP